jgi:hypothetical protein
MNEVGTEQVQAQRQDAINRMKQAFEKSQQQAGFTEQEKLQAKTQEFEHAERQTEYGVQARAAGATRQFESEQQKEKLTSEESRTHETVQGRENAALIRAAGSGSPKGAAAGKPEWEMKALNAGPGKNPDGTANYNVPQQVMGYSNNRTGAVYNLQGNRAYAWDNSKMQSIRDPKSTNNSVKPGEVEDLLRDPLGTIPDGPNQGLRKLDVFEQAHGYVPTPALKAATAASQQQQQQSQGSTRPLTLIGGQQVNVPQGGGGPQAPEPPDMSDATSD